MGLQNGVIGLGCAGDTSLSAADALTVTGAPPTSVPLGELTLDLARGRLSGPGGDIALRAKSFALLCHLARNRGRVLAKEELIAVIWPGLTVTDESLTQCVHDVRTALGPSAGALLRTVPRRGYVLEAGPTDAHTADTPIPGSIAVMPFALSGPDAARDQVLFDGLAHDVISRLARLRAFHVIGRGTSFSQRHMADNPVGFGQLVPVAYLVTGRAQRRGTQFHLHVDLLDCRDGHILWSDVFAMAADAVMQAAALLPDPITTAIAREVTAQERRLALRAPPDQPPDAWRAFHMGLNLLFRSMADLQTALDHFTTAISLDPAFGRAHAFVSFCHYSFAVAARDADRDQAVQAAYAAAASALNLDDASPVAHWAYGRALWLLKDPEGGLRHVRHALDLCPSFPQAHYMAGFVEAHQGDPARALAHLAAFESLSPLDQFIASSQLARATALARLGDATGAADMAVRAASHHRGYDVLQGHAALILAGLGRVEHAAGILAHKPANLPALLPQDLFKIIYDGPDDMCRLLQAGATALKFDRTTP